MEEKNNKLEKKIKLLKSKLKLNMNLKKEEAMNLQQASEIPLLYSKEKKEKKIGEVAQVYFSSNLTLTQSFVHP